MLVETSGEFAIGATGVLRATTGGEPVEVTDLNDSPLPSILVGPKGAHQAFKADISDGILDFGSVELPVISIEAQRAALEAVTAAVAASAAATAAAASAEAAETAATDAAAAAVAVQGAWVVVHGDNTAMARPVGAAGIPVVWYGTAEPANADSTLDVFQRIVNGEEA